MHYRIVDLPQVTHKLDEIWFRQHPDRGAMLRRPYFDERIFADDDANDVLVSVIKCLDHCNVIHRQAAVFQGKCLRLRLDTDAETLLGIQLILAEPDGPGN